ncbi:LOW QUALITY PROTEIN: T214B-like protein [Mya arenaria]|uniref:T214B-like protein n=1 Tax=Mya arenaria TaxID=6604 RepID=A0ABY7FKR7_MYAAR|nr:LOW QUALITY PROTEIN: T214B-like protein [Mya arenaria]
MASSGNWSVVGKTTKKGKPSGSPLTKSQKKQFMENMPRIIPADPMQESSTIYDAFVQKEQQRYEKKMQEKFAEKIEAGKEPNGKGISDGGMKKKHVQKTKKDQPQKKKPFEEAIKQVSEEDLRSVLLQSKGHFPDKPDLWLKDLVTFLNMKLENCIESDKHLQPDATDFPASSLKKGCTRVLTGAMSAGSLATLDHVLYFCVNTMLEEGQAGVPTFGYKIFIQLLVRTSSDTVLTKLQQYQELVRSCQNRPDRCLSVLWALGQVGYPSLKAGLRVWLDLMCPLLGNKALGGYLPGNNPQTLAQGSKNKSTTLRNFFPSYLVRAKSDTSKQLRAEVLSSMVECLSVDQQCFPMWCQLYQKHMTQSRLLLLHLSDNWEKLRARVDGKILQQALMTFLRTNEETTGNKSADELAAMNTLCEDFLKKLSKPRFPWRWVMLALVTMVIGVVAYDIMSSKTLKESKTVQFLEMYGVLGVLEQAWDHLYTYTSMAASWLQVNVPVYMSQARAAGAPVVTRAGEYLGRLEEATRENRQQALNKISYFI